MLYHWLAITLHSLLIIIGSNDPLLDKAISLFNSCHSDQAAVFIEGSAVARETITEIRKKVGIVFQNPDDQLFTPTVFDDVAFGPLNRGVDKAKIPQIVRESLERVNMADFIDRTSHHLSLGEKKKVSLATILSCSPSLIVLDEPTGNLDSKTGEEIMSVLAGIHAGGSTIILVTHEFSIAEHSNRVVRLKDGLIESDETIKRTA